VLPCFATGARLRPPQSRGGRARRQPAMPCAEALARLAPLRPDRELHPASSASRAAEAKRSAGTGAKHRSTTCSTGSGMVARTVRSRGAGPPNRRAITAWAVGPVNGGSPASISYSTQPAPWLDETRLPHSRPPRTQPARTSPVTYQVITPVTYQVRRSPAESWGR
jgi:hypothetical protein